MSSNVGTVCWTSCAALLAVGLALLWRCDPRVASFGSTRLAGCRACLIALPLGTLLAVDHLQDRYAWPRAGRRGSSSACCSFRCIWSPARGTPASAFKAGTRWRPIRTWRHQPWLAGWRAAIWVHGLAAVPWVVLIVGAGLRAVEAEIEEDAATCASPLKVLWHVSIRRAAPAIAVAAVWIATIVMTEISVTDFFQVRTFAEEVYTQAALGTFDSKPGRRGSAEPQATSRRPAGAHLPERCRVRVVDRARALDRYRVGADRRPSPSVRRPRRRPAARTVDLATQPRRWPATLFLAYLHAARRRAARQPRV